MNQTTKTVLIVAAVAAVAAVGYAYWKKKNATVQQISAPTSGASNSSSGNGTSTASTIHAASDALTAVGNAYDNIFN